MTPESPSQSVKRAKRSHPSDEGAAAGACLPALSNFSLLPHELRSLIINFACRLPASASSFASQTTTGAQPPLDDGGTAHAALPGLDTRTTLNLVRASRSLYALVTPLIFSHVWLSRPSQLVSFQQAIAARPQLGRLVKHLHVGPDNELPEWWFPTDEIDSYFESDPSEDGDGYQPATSYITTTLRSEKEAHLLPSGCSPRSLWGFQQEGRNPQSTAICKALMTAVRVINVNMLVSQRDWETDPISKVTWTQRAFDVHAAFELYLIRCQEFEREKGIRWKHMNEPMARNDPRRAVKYPILVLRGFPSRPRRASDEPASGDETFVVTRSDVLRHLARPGAVTDRFDHPLLFARSGWDTETRATLNDTAHRFDDEEEDFVDLFSPSHGYEVPANSSTRSADVLDPSVPSTATLGSLTAQLRSVLSLTPFLANLSLTGFLERAICGARSTAPLLKALRVLSLGPPPMCWLGPMRLSTLYRTRKLRITGRGVSEEGALEIAAHLSDLEELDWRVPGRMVDPHSLSRSINILLGRSEASLEGRGGSVTAAGSLRREAATDSTKNAEVTAADDRNMETSPLSTSHNNGGPLVTMRLHPGDVKFLLDSAPSEDVRRAWQSGDAWGTGLCRLLLVENDPPFSTVSWAVGNFATNLVYEDGRKWWVKHGGLHGEV